MKEANEDKFYTMENDQPSNQTYLKVKLMSELCCVKNTVYNQNKHLLHYLLQN